MLLRTSRTSPPWLGARAAHSIVYLRWNELRFKTALVNENKLIMGFSLPCTTMFGQKIEVLRDTCGGLMLTAHLFSRSMLCSRQNRFFPPSAGSLQVHRMGRKSVGSSVAQTYKDTQSNTDLPFTPFNVANGKFGPLHTIAHDGIYNHPLTAD
jgi:hypothetical protein